MPPLAPSLFDRVLRLGATSLHRLISLRAAARGRRTYGAHAIALTPERHLVLVRLRYASGWRLPGGGRDGGEDPRAAVLRELREEIGLTAHGKVTLATELDQRVAGRRDLAALLIVEQVRFTPKRFSWEIERVVAAPLDDLPPDLAPITRQWIAAVAEHL